MFHGTSARSYCWAEASAQPAPPRPWSANGPSRWTRSNAFVARKLTCQLVALGEALSRRLLRRGPLLADLRRLTRVLAGLAFERCELGLERAALSRSFLGARAQARRVLAHLLDSGVQALFLEVSLGERLAQRGQPGLQFLVLNPCGLFFPLDFLEPLRCLGAFSLDGSHILPKPPAFGFDRDEARSQDHFQAR